MSAYIVVHGSDVFRMLPSYRIVFEILRDIVRVVRGRFELKEARVKEREQRAFMNGLLWGVGIGAAIAFLVWFSVASSARSQCA